MIPYIINVALILAGCLAFYKILLQKETFYRLNRYVLVGCLLISFSLPLLPIPQQWSLRKAENISNSYTPALLPLEGEKNTTTSKQTVSPGKSAKPDTTALSNSFSLEKFMSWLVLLYWFGVIAFGINFLIQLILLLYRAYTKPVIVDGRFRIVEISGDRAPCSFANFIFINPEKYDWETYSQILMHEKLHVQQRHSFDIMLAEIMLIFQWFNPFAWIYRKEIESNLEFLTDDQMVHRQEIERSSYQLSLLKVSAPHSPLSLTTNYNQSLLKKRIVMMNSKRSNVHTAWKYFFLLPLLVFFACILNKPIAYSQTDPVVKDKEKIKPEHKNELHGLETEGSWFATIKNDKISMQFKQNDEDEHSYHGSTFSLSEFPNLPRETAGSFKLTREAGTMEFTGKFEGDQGMGHYKFTSDQSYGAYMSTEINEKLSERDLMVFFFIDIKKNYVKMLKDQGYAKVDKNQLIPLAALKVDADFIRSLRENGYKDVSLQDLIPLKSLGIDGSYIKEIRSAGYPNISVNELITFKAQGIDKEYLSKVRSAQSKDGKAEKSDLEPQVVVGFRSLHVDEEYINSLKAVGLTNIPNQQLISLKAVGVTPEFVKTFQEAGYKNISAEELVPLKSQNITPEFIKSFEAIGFKDIPLHQVIALKALNITPAYIKSMKEKGFNYYNVQKYITLKSIE